MRFDYFIISMLLACLFILGGLNFIGETTNTYNTTVNDTYFTNVTDAVDDIYDKGDDTKEGLLANEVTYSGADDNLLLGAYKAVVDFFKYSKNAFKLLGVTGNAIGIPAWIMNMLAIMMMFSILFGIVYLAFRFQPK